MELLVHQRKNAERTGPLRLGQTMRLLCPILVLSTGGCAISPALDRYTAGEIDYFTEIAFGAEYGDVAEGIIKWEKDLRVEARGSPTESDRKELERVVEDLNGMLEPIQIRLVVENPNVVITWAPVLTFPAIEPNYEMAGNRYNVGYLWVTSRRGWIQRARILVATDETIRRRRHILREELTQVLGLINDSHRYPDSMFYEERSEQTRYADVDRALIEMLYRSEIRPGMRPEQVRAVLGDLTR